MNSEHSGDEAGISLVVTADAPRRQAADPAFVQMRGRVSPSGTAMLKLSDATRAVRRLLALAYKDRRLHAEACDEHLVFAKDKEIRAFRGALAALHELPIFINPTPDLS